MYEYEKPDRFKKKSFPLFGEHARKTDPPASKDRAKKLSGSKKLSDQALTVLLYISRYPDLTADQVGIEVSRLNGTRSAEWPHKVASKLANKGWIVRTGSPFLLRITPEGLKQLKENSNE